MNAWRCFVVDLHASRAAELRVMALVLTTLLIVAGLSVTSFQATDLEGTLPVSPGDCIVAVFGGLEEVQGERYRLPFAWLVSSVVLFLLTLTYPFRDLTGFGRGILVAGGSRWSWWLAKCLWVTVWVLFTWALLVSLCVMLSALIGGSITLETQPQLAYLLQMQLEEVLLERTSALPFLCQAICASIALSLVQLTLSLVLGPVLSFLSMTALMVTSTFSLSPWLAGNLLMWSRSSLCRYGGISPQIAIATSAAIAIVAVVAGGLAFARMDIVDRERFE